MKRVEPKTAEQINREQGLIPMGVEGRLIRRHPLTCGKCRSVVNTALCAKCQLDCTSCRKQIAQEIKERLQKGVKYYPSLPQEPYIIITISQWLDFWKEYLGEEKK